MTFDKTSDISWWFFTHASCSCRHHHNSGRSSHINYDVVWRCLACSDIVATFLLHPLSVSDGLQTLTCLWEARAAIVPLSFDRQPHGYCHHLSCSFTMRSIANIFSCILVVHISCLILFCSIPVVHSMASPFYSHPNAIIVTHQSWLRRSSTQSCLFSSLDNNKTRGGDIVIRTIRSTRKTQQVYIGVSLAILLFPSVAYPAMRMCAAVVVAASIFNLIQGNGLIIFKRW
jgi:hypothetical protein